MTAVQTRIAQVLQSDTLVRVGHRGAAAIAPENTISSIAAALECGMDMVEFDVVRRSDGRLVLAHGAEDIGEDSPTLEDALMFLNAEAPPTTVLDLDLKVGGVESEIVEVLDRFALVERTIVCALHASWLQAVRRVDPRVVIGLSYPRDRAGIARSGRYEPLVRAGTSAMRRLLPRRVVGMARRAGASAIMLHHSVVSADVVERCRRNALPVFAWTVDDPTLLRTVIDAGVHGVITNDPRTLSKYELEK